MEILRNELRAALHDAVQVLSDENIEFEVRRADIEDFASRGEYSSNIAFALRAKIGSTKASTPLALAQELCEELGHHEKLQRIFEIEAQNGFLNFRMNDSTLFDALERALEQGRDYGASTHLEGARINVEFVSADPTGPLSLHHGRIAACGEALCRLLETQGADVTREYFLNDIETSTKMRLLGESVAALYLEAFGQNASPPEGAVRDAFTRSVAQSIASQKGNSLLLLPEAERGALCAHEARQVAVMGQKSTLKKLGIHFDVWTSESALSRDRLLESVLEKLRASGHTFEEGGALWLRTTAFGDEADRPLRRRGEYTYLAADIAYHAYRFERSFDSLFNIWTAEHRQYVGRTHAALRAADFPSENLEVLICEDAQLLRDGAPVQTEDSEPSLDETLEEIEAPALRFLLLLNDWSEPTKIETEIARRDDESNPSYAARLLPSRLSTLLRQDEGTEGGSQGSELSEAEKNLARLVALWPDELETAARERRPQRVARFVLEMAGATRELLSASRPNRSTPPLLLRASQIVTSNALRVLGVEANERF